MPRFYTNRDVGFIKGINKELIDKVIETTIILYSLDPESNKANLYGENTEKVFLPGIAINALITNSDETTSDTEMGPNVFQEISCAFYRNTLKELNFYPERGDYIKYNFNYYEITSVIDNQFIAGRTLIPHSVICTANLVDKSVINVRYNN